MRTLSQLIVTPLAMCVLVSSSAVAQERHAVPPAALANVVMQHSAAADADRASVREALNRPEVQTVAAHAGLSVERLSATVESMDPSTLARAAASARDVNAALTGGASTITISTTTIIIVLLLVIIILVAD